MASLSPPNRTRPSLILGRALRANISMRRFRRPTLLSCRCLSFVHSLLFGPNVASLSACLLLSSIFFPSLACEFPSLIAVLYSWVKSSSSARYNKVFFIMTEIISSFSRVMTNAEVREENQRLPLLHDECATYLYVSILCVVGLRYIDTCFLLSDE